MSEKQVKKIPTYCHLTKTERRKLAKLAKDQGRTLSGMLAAMVREYEPAQ